MQCPVRGGGAVQVQVSQSFAGSVHDHMLVAASPNVQRVVHMQRVSPSRSSRVGSGRTSRLQLSVATRNRDVLSLQSSGFVQGILKQQKRLASPTAATANHRADVVHTEWTAPCGTVFEVLELRSQQHQQQHHAHDINSSGSKPAVVLIHGLFRAAWYWTEFFMPQLAAAGHDSYALSLRGQGSSQQLPAAAANQQQQQQRTSSSNSSSKRPFKHGVPLAVNVADIGAFIHSRGFSQPPILIGHSLGGMFIQEYMHTFIWQQQQQQQQGSAAAAAGSFSTTSTPAAAAAATPAAALLPHLDNPLPELAGVVLLASACAGTVMSFGRFISDVGVLEFMHQMMIVLSQSHLKHVSTARYCWWESDMSESDAEQHLRMIQKSSSVLPYITAEVGGWYPPAPSAAELALLPPVLAIGGSADRIIRPFQVTAAGEYWGAEVRILQGVTHDVLLGPQAAAVSEDILSWLETLPPVPVHSKAVDAGIWPRWRGLRNVGDAADASVGRVL